MLKIKNFSVLTVINAMVLLVFASIATGDSVVIRFKDGNTVSYDSSQIETISFAQSSASFSESSTFLGTWRFVANNYLGKIEFQKSGHGWTGRVWFDVTQRWEQLVDISFNPATGAIQFMRPEPNQLYKGTLAGNKMKGSFTQSGTGNYQWDGEKK